jgi:hypothetical protein
MISKRSAVITSWDPSQGLPLDICVYTLVREACPAGMIIPSKGHGMFIVCTVLRQTASCPSPALRIIKIQKQFQRDFDAETSCETGLTLIEGACSLGAVQNMADCLLDLTGSDCQTHFTLYLGYPSC